MDNPNSPKDDGIRPEVPNVDENARGAKGTTELGQTGTDDMRTSIAPGADNPTADDPYDNGVLTDEVDDRNLQIRREQHQDVNGENGPTYERDQGDKDPDTGGSTDPNNTRSTSDTPTEE